MGGRFLDELIRRRVPQVTGVYLAAGWGLLEFSDWATGRFGWASWITTAVMLVWLLLLPVLVGAAWKFGRPALQIEQSPVVPPDRSIAVLPLENMSGDPDNDYLGDGISDEIIGALTRIEGLRVASRTSSFSHRNRQDDVRAIGRALGVSSVLEGSVHRSGERLRVSAQLVDVADGYHLWSQRFDRLMEDVFSIEDEIAENVADALRILLRRGQRPLIRRVPPTNIEAYEYYLRGRYFFRKSTRKHLVFAREMFEHAIQIDAEYAAAYVGLADSVCLLVMFYPAAEVDLAVADNASRRALEFAPQLAGAHASRGLLHFLQHDREAASAAFSEAIRLDPALFEARYFFGRTRFQDGAFGEAADLFDEAFRLSGDYNAAFFAGQSYEALDRQDSALASYRKAADAVARHLELNPDDARACTFRAVALARIGSKREAFEWAQRAVDIDPRDGGVQYNVACFYAVAGESGRALDCLEAARSAGFGHLDWLEKDPDLESLRGEPRFLALVAEAQTTR